MYLRVTHGRFDPGQSDAVLRLLPDVLNAIRGLPGIQDVRSGVDRDAGRTVSVTTFDSLEHAQFQRERLGRPLTDLLALGWQGDAPEIVALMS